MNTRNDIVRTLAFAAAAAIFTLLFLSLAGCKCPCSVIPGGTHDHDSVHTEYVHDSVTVYKIDSIFRDRWRTGDTVFMETTKYQKLYRDREVIKHDSVYINNTDTIYQQIEVTKPINNFWKGSGIAFWILLALLMIGVATGIAIKIIKK